MGIMPHTNVERALELALSLDIPFWPQLPNLSFYEDMYAQTSVISARLGSLFKVYLKGVGGAGDARVVRPDHHLQGMPDFILGLV